MAIKQRTLIRLNATKHNILRAIGAGSKAALVKVCRDLTETRNLYREGLSQQNYTAYGEICDGLILAVRQMIDDGNKAVRGEALALCNELLEHLERETEKETRFKKEIVFLPYKASMWDSLESVWKAAYEDKEHCNAYVMPIPYADLNPDRSIAAWHCEKDEFPKYVPTLDWQEINLKTWHPDVIFIHNPYDNYNLVTSVKSKYYSRNLRECADKLVYIPYFVLDEPCSEESVEHFVLMPGVFNADKVIVQSESMRELYINILTKKTNQTDRAYWEAHISGAGSPKIEKVLTSKKDDFDMPEKWRKLVEGRKVILYNTSLGAMLQNSDKVCDKLRYVFDVFRNRDDVALWWRPHPLMKATFHSMRPEVEKEYLKIEKQYIEEGWGIYDDTSDLHRAICWSDAYYGDGSSVVRLYCETDKPLMLERLDESFSGISLTNIIEFKDELYFTSFKVNGLFKYNAHQGQIKKIINFEDYPLVGNYAGGLFFETIFVDEKIYFFPYCASDMYCYDMVMGKIKKICINADDEKFSGEIARFLPIKVDNSFWIIRGRGSVIIRFDLISETYHIYKNWYHTLEKSKIPNLQQCFFSDMIQVEQYLYFVINKTNILIRFSMENYCAEVFRVGDGEYISLAYDGISLWLYSINSDLYCVDILSHQYTVIPNILQINTSCGNTIIYKNSKIYAFRDDSMDYAIFDTKSHSLSYQKVPIHSSVRTIIRESEEKIYILPFAGNSMVSILPDGSYKIDEFQLEEFDIDFYRKVMNGQNLYDESDFIDLSDFLEDVTKEESTNNVNIFRLGTSYIGQQIFSDVKEAL